MKIDHVALSRAALEREDLEAALAHGSVADARLLRAQEAAPLNIVYQHPAAGLTLRCLRRSLAPPNFKPFLRRVPFTDVGSVYRFLLRPSGQLHVHVPAVNDSGTVFFASGTRVGTLHVDGASSFSPPIAFAVSAVSKDVVALVDGSVWCGRVCAVPVGPYICTTLWTRASG